MAKQIYIDSNGNEVLVSGTITNDNNLPHYTGTPTAGTTAYEIAKDSEILTYTSGANKAIFTFSRFGNMVCILISREGSAMGLPTTWTTISGTLSANFRPATTLSVCAITGDNHPIFIQIDTSGTVQIYSAYSGNLYPSGTCVYVSTAG